MQLRQIITQLYHALDEVPNEETQELRGLVNKAQTSLDNGSFSEADELLHLVAQRINHLITRTNNLKL